MSIVSRFTEMTKSRGLKGTLQYAARKSLGIETYEDRFNTLFYFLNLLSSPGVIPKAEGELGMVQAGDTLLLAITDEVCRQHGLDYWIDGGTCLGAIRHKGFIPWDDDMDICMMRDVYERALPILKEELGKYGIDAEEETNEPIARIGIGYHHYETGLWIDLLPAEYTTIDARDTSAVANYCAKSRKYQKGWLKKRGKLNREQMFEYRKKFIPEICEKDQAKSIIYCPEFGLRPRLWSVEDVFPLQETSFEGYKVLGPNNPHNYFLQFYGSSYMSFPQTGVAHHGGERGGLISWAKQSGTDMAAIIKDLEGILEKIQKEP